MIPPIPHSSAQYVSDSNSTDLLEREPLKSVITLQKIIEQGSTKEIVVSHYDRIPCAIQLIIKESMENVSHGYVTKFKAEKLIHPKVKASKEKEEAFKQNAEIEKVNHLFHLALKESIENVLLPQVKGIDELKELKHQMDQKTNPLELEKAFVTLSLWTQCAIAKEMREQLMYDEEAPFAITLGDLRKWARDYICTQDSRQTPPLTASNSLFYSAVEALIDCYTIEWNLDGQTSSSDADLQGSSSKIITD